MKKAKGGQSIRDLVLAGVMGTLMTMGQVLMSSLPNIEPVSLLVIVYTLYRPKQARAAIAVFVLLEGVVFGFGVWWFTYLYVWHVLHFITLATRKMAGPVFCALLAGAYGLAFGALTSLPYFITAGLGGGFAYWVAGIPFDILHCIGNFALVISLYVPLTRLFCSLEKNDKHTHGA